MKREKLSWSDFAIDKEALSKAIDKRETGAIEFALLLKSGTSTKEVADCLAAGHGMGLKAYLKQLITYLLRKKIFVLRKPAKKQRIKQ